MKIIQIENTDQANLASSFLRSENAFEDSKEWNIEEQEYLFNTPYRTFNTGEYYSWMAIEDENIIGYIDLRDHDLKNKGFYTDWFAVHKGYRSKGIGSLLLSEVEAFAKSIDARYILIETGDVEKYKRTRNFYENHGYVKVGHIPEYYYKDWGMYIFQKMFK